MTAIIIEDEALAARELESILKKLAPEIEIVARQDSVRGSVQWLKENQVDLIFSDVHLGDGRSFDIFGQVEIKAPVIFITAYDEYALQAFKSQGIDYILKPFDEEEILRALEKVRNWFAKEKKAPRTVRFQERFLVQIGTKIKSVPVAEVAYFMADGKYLMLYTHEGGGYILDGCTRRTPGSPNLFSDQPEVYSELFCYQRNDPLFQQPHKNRFISFAS